MTKLSIECTVPTLTQAERDALGVVIREAINRFLYYGTNPRFTEDDLELLREMKISA